MCSVSHTISLLLTDVDDVKFVINFDFPNCSEDYIHRIGRTGRSDKTGTAYAFFTPNNSKQANELIAVLKEANQVVNPKLYEMVNMSKSLGGKARNRWGAGAGLANSNKGGMGRSDRGGRTDRGGRGGGRGGDRDRSSNRGFGGRGGRSSGGTANNSGGRWGDSNNSGGVGRNTRFGNQGGNSGNYQSGNTRMPGGRGTGRGFSGSGAPPPLMSTAPNAISNGGSYYAGTSNIYQQSSYANNYGNATY